MHAIVWSGMLAMLTFLYDLTLSEDESQTFQTVLVSTSAIISLVLLVIVSIVVMQQ